MVSVGKKKSWEGKKNTKIVTKKNRNGFTDGLFPNFFKSNEQDIKSILKPKVGK